MTASPSGTPLRHHLNHLPALDVLRGIAVLLVVAYHCDLNWGWIGVDLFFVLSGFLITRILLATASDPHYFRTFYIRRALRIFPLYYLTIFVSFIGLLLSGSAADRYLVDLASCLVYVQNFVTGNDYKHFYPPLIHFWSLAIEEQFYIFWPAVVLWAGARRLPVLCAAAIVVIGLGRSLAVAHGMPIGYANYDTPFRIDALLMGCLLTCGPAWIRGGLCAAVFMAIGASLTAAAVVGSHSGDWQSRAFCEYGFTGVDLFFAGLLVTATTMRDPQSWWGFGTLRGLGRLSYCIYIAHIPMLWVFERSGMKTWVADQTGPLVQWVAEVGFIIGTSYALAWLSYRYFEGRFLKLKSRWRYAKIDQPI